MPDPTTYTPNCSKCNNPVATSYSVIILSDDNLKTCTYQRICKECSNNIDKTKTPIELILFTYQQVSLPIHISTS